MCSVIVDVGPLVIKERNAWCFSGGSLCLWERGGVLRSLMRLWFCVWHHCSVNGTSVNGTIPWRLVGDRVSDVSTQCDFPHELK